MVPDIDWYPLLVANGSHQMSMRRIMLARPDQPRSPVSNGMLFLYFR